MQADYGLFNWYLQNLVNFEKVIDIMQANRTLES